MGVRKLTDEQEKEICRLYVSEGIFSPELGRMFGVRWDKIKNCLIRNGINLHGRRCQIMAGDRFGKWVIIKEVEKRRGGARYFLCECSCPLRTQREVQLSHLKSGVSKSCGCYKKEYREERKEDYTRQTFGRLTILYEIERDKHGSRQVMAQCSCDGNIDRYRLSVLTGGQTLSCRCLNIEKIKISNTNQVKDYRERHPAFYIEEEIRDRDNEPGIEVRCKKCRKWFPPSSHQLWGRINVIENEIGMADQNFYCSTECKLNCSTYRLKSDPNTKAKQNLNIPSSYELAIWAQENLTRQRDEFGYNFCTINASHPSDNLIAHHIHPKKLEPWLALDPENCIIVCRDCHEELHKGECSAGALAYTKCKVKTGINN